MTDVQLCPSCGCYQRRGMLCMKCAKEMSSTCHGDGAVVMVPVSQMREWQDRIAQLRAEVNAHGLKFEAVISNPSPFEGWDSAPSRKAELITSLAQMDELLNKPQLKQWVPPVADIVISEMEGLADALDAKELEPTLTEQEIATMLAEIEEKMETKPLKHVTINPMALEFGEHGSPMRMVQTKKWLAENVATDKCKPYLSEDVYIESCQIVGKGVTDCCKHLIGRLDYCHECEHEHDDPIDLSEESI